MLKEMIKMLIVSFILILLIITIFDGARGYHQRTGGYCDKASNYERAKIDYLIFC